MTDKKRNSISEFGVSLKRMILNYLRANLVDGIITEVDTVKFTCSVKTQLTEFHNVPLRVLISSQASFIEIPKLQTNCLMTFRNMNTGRPQLFSVHESEKTILTVGSSSLEITDSLFNFNTGSLGGLVKVNDLLTKINNLEYTLNALIDKFNSHTHPGVSSGSSSTAPTTSQEGGRITPTQLNEIENTKIKQ
jgi:hypothetical protein